ncbi:MAG: hypothetical protein P9M15_06500 [Candidatus Electryoneaceae bacterium]|nr:hypothetical protein [Candidatus Electryoneaceae bacterium]
MFEKKQHTPIRDLLFLMIWLSWLLLGCATTKPRLATVDFNPVNEWDGSKKLFVLPFNITDSTNYQIEKKLSQLIDRTGNYIELDFTSDIDSADAIIFVKVEFDTRKHIVPGRQSTTTYSFSGYNEFLNIFQNWHLGQSTIVPPVEIEVLYGSVSLWITNVYENDIFERNSTVLVSYASKNLYADDPLFTLWSLTKECLLVLPDINSEGLYEIPILGIHPISNWLGGVKVLPRYEYGRVISPFISGDVIFEIDGTFINDPFDYMAALIGMGSDQKKCIVKFNRRGKILQETIRLRRSTTPLPYQ